MLTVQHVATTNAEDRTTGSKTHMLILMSTYTVYTRTGLAIEGRLMLRYDMGPVAHRHAYTHSHHSHRTAPADNLRTPAPAPMFLSGRAFVGGSLLD